MKNLAIIGSSGSIGKQTLSVVRRYPDKFRVVALVVKSNIDLLYEQINEFHPDFVGIYDEAAYKNFNCLDKSVKAVVGKDALTFACALKEVDTVVVSVSCMDGIYPLIAAIENDKVIALANKESIVAGGDCVFNKLKNSNAKILPVDSEHSAIWQILDGNDKGVKRIILTASGGGFYGKDREFLQTVTPAQAVKHPNWSMGKKISVDSATMVNKGLEIIEAARLFSNQNIDYMIHPQSIVHSMVEYDDGAVMAQMGVTSMELPIQYALTYPERLPTKLQPLTFDKPLTFLSPDEKNFPAPKIAKQCLKAGGIMPCVYSAADEVAVSLFLEGKIRFTQIVDIIEESLKKTENFCCNDIEEIYGTYNKVTNQIRKEYGN